MELITRLARTWPAPVEYAVAVDRYLADAALGEASRRVYRISLTGWTWPLVGFDQPAGAGRRGARPPVVPLALLDDEEVPALLAAAFAARALRFDVRTINRELSALRSAVGWWQDLGWISRDPTAGLRMRPGLAPPAVTLTDQEVVALFSAVGSLRERAFWGLLRDTGVPAPVALNLDANVINRMGHLGAHLDWPAWSERTADLLGWLLSGRTTGPVFLTDRKASPGLAKPDICPLTGRARMSYRRAAEIFTTSTRLFDPAGHGWTLRQLRIG